VIDQNNLAVLAKEGNRGAAELLLKSNEKFVYMIARQYIGQGMELNDLTQEGFLGILKAIERFDPKIGTKFLTYASWWIKQSILLALAEHNRQVRLPLNRITILEQYKRAKNVLDQSLMREASQEEILSSLDMDKQDLYIQYSASYHNPVPSEDNDVSMLDIIPNNTPSPDSKLMEESLRQEIGIALKNLPGREQIILKMSFGLGYERCFTLEEIGDKLGLTRERIRQLRIKALKKLKKLNRKKKLENLKG
jgi:RNA polymerase primary sigma factor